MVDIEFEKIDERITVRFRREYRSEVLQRSYMTNELIIVVREAHLDDIKSDFAAYALLSEAEQRAFINRLRLVPHYTGPMLESQEERS